LVPFNKKIATVKNINIEMLTNFIYSKSADIKSLMAIEDYNEISFHRALTAYR
jgi:hypothetical protein